MPFDRSEAIRAVLLVIAGIVTVFAVMLCIPSARAAWKAGMESASPKVQAWFRDQRNAAGESCCDKSDGHPFFGGYKLNPDGSATLQTEAGPHTLPPFMVLKGPNPTGHAIWWFTATRDYCFAPGTLT